MHIHPYFFYIQSKIALMFSVFGAELPLQKSWSGENAAYKNHGLDKIALAFSISGEELVYDFCVWHRVALTFFVFGVESHLRIPCFGEIQAYVYCI